jgi:chorismate mutase
MIDKKSVRQQIDAADEQLLALINQRLQLAQTIGEIKNREELATLDPKREQ